MTTALLILFFVALAGLFAHGAASSIADPRPTDLDIQQLGTDGVMEVGKAICVGIMLLLAGIGTMTLF